MTDHELNQEKERVRELILACVDLGLTTGKLLYINKHKVMPKLKNYTRKSFHSKSLKTIEDCDIAYKEYEKEHKRLIFKEDS